MANYQVVLMGRELLAEGTMGFRFTKPAGFAFSPGQAVTVSLNDPPAEPNSESRTFSLVSAPFESELMIATRLRAGSAFKRALATLPDGSSVKLDGAFGDLTLDAAGAPAVFIAGGIGITPFVSMLRQAVKDALSRPLRLIYSNRRPEDAAFLAELRQLERQNRHFRLLATMTDMGQSARRWDGETGFVDAGLVNRFIEDLAVPVFYVVGPPAMVHAMQETLGRAGVAEDRIRTEAYYGY